jgi:hypothetical protein
MKDERSRCIPSYYTNKQCWSLDLFEIPSDMLRSMLVRQESCLHISSSPLSVAHRDSCYLCSQWRKAPIDDRPAALASSHWGKYNYILWLNIYMVDDKEWLYRFGTCMQFGTEMNWIDFSIELNVNSCNSCTVLRRLGVINVLTDCLRAISLNCNENSVVIGTVWYQSRNWIVILIAKALYMPIVHLSPLCTTSLSLFYDFDMNS